MKKLLYPLHVIVTTYFFFYDSIRACAGVFRYELQSYREEVTYKRFKETFL